MSAPRPTPTAYRGVYCTLLAFLEKLYRKFKMWSSERDSRVLHRLLSYFPHQLPASRFGSIRLERAVLVAAVGHIASGKSFTLYNWQKAPFIASTLPPCKQPSLISEQQLCRLQSLPCHSRQMLSKTLFSVQASMSLTTTSSAFPKVSFKCSS
jgi:hypothetical protein